MISNDSAFNEKRKTYCLKKQSKRRPAVGIYAVFVSRRLKSLGLVVVGISL